MTQTDRDFSQDKIEQTEKQETTSGQDDVNYDMFAAGPLFVDPRHKKPGYQYGFVADQPGMIDLYKRWGYNVVQDEINPGDQTAATSTKFGSAVTVQSKCGQLLVYMAISDDKHKKLEAHREKFNQEKTAAIKTVDGIPQANMYGDIKFSTF